MYAVKFLPPAARFIKKIKDKKLKSLYKDAIDAICSDPSVGTAKTGDLAGIYGYDIFITKQIMNWRIQLNMRMKS